MSFKKQDRQDINLNKMELDKKKAIVTSVSMGLGAALAEALVAKGAIVYGLSRNIEKLNTIQNKSGD